MGNSSIRTGIPSGSSFHTQLAKREKIVGTLKSNCKVLTLKSRVGIFGGSFNPVHTGHIRLAKCLLRLGAVDELWLLVSPLNPLKQGNTDLLDDEVRLQLTQMAVKNIPGLVVSDFEMHLPRPSYMVHTLQQLRTTYPDREFILIIGADNWLRFPQWKDNDEILRHHRLLVYPRPGYSIDTSTLPEGVQLVHTPHFDISSTEIRQAIAGGHYHGRGLTPAVWKEIKKNHYYL